MHNDNTKQYELDSIPAAEIEEMDLETIAAIMRVRSGIRGGKVEIQPCL